MYFCSIMATSLHNSPIYGPVHSRRLGLSLGINLMPADGKICTFDCIYCECGYNKNRIPKSQRPTRSEIKEALERQLESMRQEGVLPDVLTFAGNGEPTAHPDFAGIISDTISLRNEYCHEAKIAVLSNATMITKPEVFEALTKVDDNILKLDTIDTKYITLVNRPLLHSYNVKKLIDIMKAFNGHVIIQTMFMRGTMDGKDVDNTSDRYIQPWLKVLKEIEPEKVMIYTIDRNTPDTMLEKTPRTVIDTIKERVEAIGIECTAGY